MVAIVELIDPRPYMFQPAVYGRLIYTVIYMSDRLLTQANPNPHLPPPPELRSTSKVLHMLSWVNALCVRLLVEAGARNDTVPQGAPPDHTKHEHAVRNHAR